jgi:cell division protein FtsB
VRTVLIILAVLLVLAQLRLWSEVREVRSLRVLVEAQFEENQRLDSRNEALAAEVEDLRAGLQAIEERARAELGLIREDEEFFLIIDPEHADPEPR